MLSVGDKILEVNGSAVKDRPLEEVRDMHMTVKKLANIDLMLLEGKYFGTFMYMYICPFVAFLI